MSNKVTYEYAIIRLVPKVEREEFMNVGVLLFSKRKKYLGIQYQLDEARIQAFTKVVDIDVIRQYLEAWKHVCDGAQNGGPIGEFELAKRFRWLAATRSTIIQSSNTHPGLCDDPERVLEKLFHQYVLQE